MPKNHTPTSRPHLRKLWILVLALATVFIITSLAAVGAELVYAEQLPPGVFIAGHQFAGQNRVALRSSLEKLFADSDKSELTLASDDKTQTVSFSQTGIKPDFDRTIDTAFALSHSSIPGLGTMHALAAMIDRKNQLPLYTSVDVQQNQAFVDTILHPAFGARPVDASLMIKDSSIDIATEQDGLWIDDEALMHQIENAFTHHIQTVSVPTKILKADVQAINLAGPKQEAEALLSRKVTLEAGGKTFTPSRTDIGSWIFIQENQGEYHIALDASNIKSYLTDTIAPKVNQKAVTQLTDKNGNVSQAGKDGTSLLVDDSITNIINAMAKTDDKINVTLALAINNKPTQVVDPELGCDPNKAPGKYIEVNLTMQKMCLYDGATFVNTFRVSTGKWSTPTPIGTFAIQNKLAVAHSREFNLEMPYWKAITPDGAYGIHGLPYRGNWVEGRGHIGTPVSHGCIRLGPGDDVYVHNWVDIGNPVFIHK